jgi:hypothetical protein
MNQPSPISANRWPLERVLFALAGSVTLLSAALSAVVSPWFLLVTAFVGVNQWLYVTARACPASIVLKRACGLRSSLYPTRYETEDRTLTRTLTITTSWPGRPRRRRAGHLNRPQPVRSPPESRP